MDACLIISSAPVIRYDKTGSLENIGNDLLRRLKAVRGQAIAFLMGKRRI
jgi:hypothetical protein